MQAEFQGDSSVIIVFVLFFLILGSTNLICSQNEAGGRQEMIPMSLISSRSSAAAGKCGNEALALWSRGSGKPFQVNSLISSPAKLTLAGKICCSLGVTADEMMWNDVDVTILGWAFKFPTKWSQMWHQEGQFTDSCSPCFTWGNPWELPLEALEFSLCVLTVVEQYLDKIFLFFLLIKF